MTSIEIETNQLNQRTRLVQKLLLPLRRPSLPVACKVLRQQIMGCKVIAAHDGVRSDDFNGLYFRTFVQNVWSQYHELWRPMSKQEKLCLERAYLNIFIINSNTHNFDKLISIHCDPYEEGDEPFCSYKRGPHLHVQKAEYPLPKCHFPLNLSELEKILSSADNITEALKNAVHIVQNEVLMRYKI